MTDQSPITPETTPFDPFAAAPAAPGTGLAVPVSKAEIASMLAPYTVDMRTWLRGIMSVEEFPEEDPEAIALGMLAQILQAPTSEAALKAFDLDRAKEMCGGEPGGMSPVLEITSARALKSDYAEGAACYAIIEAIRLTDGEMISFTTGSRSVQTVVWKHVYEGWIPFKARLQIRREKTRRGFYPISLIAGI